MFKAESNCQTSPKLAQDTPAHEPNKRTCWRMSRIHQLEKVAIPPGKPWKIHATKHVLLIVGSWSACIRAATPPNTFQREQLLLRIPAIQRLQLDSKELIKFLKYSQGQVYNKLYVLVFVPQYQPHVGLRGFLTHPFGSTNCISPSWIYHERSTHDPKPMALAPFLGTYPCEQLHSSQVPRPGAWLQERKLCLRVFQWWKKSM